MRRILAPRLFRTPRCWLQRLGGSLLVLFGVACVRPPAATQTPSTAPVQTPPANESPAPTPAEADAKDNSDDDIPVAQRDAGVPYPRFQIPVADSPVHGPADAIITIVMFSDFECPYCRQAHETLEALDREFPGVIRRVYKAYPISNHPNAMLAALIAESARNQEKFWDFHRRLFSGPRLSPGVLGDHALASGLNIDQVDADLDALTFAPRISEDLRLAKRMGVHSTPVFFINGRRIEGSAPVGVFRHFVEQEQRLAQKLEKRGVEAKDVYAYVTQFGYEGVQLEARPGELDSDLVFPVPIGEAPQRGPATAPVTIVSFGDFECPFCARGNATLEALAHRYGDQIRVVFRHFPLPFHNNGKLAARLGVVAQNAGKFWEYHDLLYGFGARFGIDDLRGIAKKLKLDAKQTREALEEEGGSIQTRLDADFDLAAMLGVRGTPTFFINGRPLGGARPELDFRFIIVEELQRAKELIQQGVAPSDLYETLTGIQSPGVELSLRPSKHNSQPPSQE